jgi:hypothetical protein
MVCRKCRQMEGHQDVRVQPSNPTLPRNAFGIFLTKMQNQNLGNSIANSVVTL